MITTIDERMQALARAVLNEAGQEAEKIKVDAQEKAEVIRRQAQENAEAERNEIINDARQKAENIKSQNIASSKLKAQMHWIERREELLNKVFEIAEERMQKTNQWSNYPEILKRMIREAAQALESKTIKIHADETTLKLLKNGLLKDFENSLGLKLHLGQSLEKGTGILAESIDGHRQFDNTMQARMQRLQDILRSTIYHILMGESL